MNIDKKKFVAIIPARFASTRFPGKPLAKIGDMSMIQRVVRQASLVLDEVYVATDSDEIYNHVISFGGMAIMTSSDHKSGTDRIAEAYVKSGSKAEVVINVQGDEPFIAPSQIEELCRQFDDARTEIATLVMPFRKEDGLAALENPNSPKVVLSPDSFALYFSRSVIPYLRGTDKSEWLDKQVFYKHIGLYAYKSEVLAQVTKLPQTFNEKSESLEQLRWLDNGYRIKVGLTNLQTIGIDTPEDLEKANNFLKSLEK